MKITKLLHVATCILATGYNLFGQQNTRNEYLLTGTEARTKKITDALQPQQYGIIGDFQSMLDNNTRRIHFTLLDNNSNELVTMKYYEINEMNTQIYTYHFIANDIAKTTDGFIICGELFEEGSQQYAFLMRTDHMGLVIWFRKYEIEDDLPYLNSVIQTDDGGFMACGYYHNRTIGSVADYARIIKTNAAGTLLWTKETPSNLYVDMNISDSKYHQIVKIGNGEYALVGVCNYFYSFAGDILLTIIDDNGNIIQNKAIGQFTDSQTGNYVIEYGKSIYYDPGNDKLTILGELTWFDNGNTCTRFNDLLILKIDVPTMTPDFYEWYDLNGEETAAQIEVELHNNSIWALSYNGLKSSLMDVDYTTGAGMTVEHYDNFTSLTLRSLLVNQNTNYDIRMVGNDDKFGLPIVNNSFMYERTFNYGHTIMCEGDQYGSITQEHETYAEEPITTLDIRRSDVPLTVQGIPNPTNKMVWCGTGNYTSPTGLMDSQNELNNVTIIPNPAHNQISISDINGSYKIMDITGKVVLSGLFKSGEQINISEINPGLYIIHITEVNGRSKSSKLVKQ